MDLPCRQWSLRIIGRSSFDMCCQETRRPSISLQVLLSDLGTVLLEHASMHNELLRCWNTSIAWIANIRLICKVINKTLFNLTPIHMGKRMANPSPLWLTTLLWGINTSQTEIHKGKRIENCLFNITMTQMVAKIDWLSTNGDRRNWQKGNNYSHPPKGNVNIIVSSVTLGSLINEVRALTVTCN